MEKKQQRHTENNLIKNDTSVIGEQYVLKLL